MPAVGQHHNFVWHFSYVGSGFSRTFNVVRLKADATYGLKSTRESAGDFVSASDARDSFRSAPNSVRCTPPASSILRAMPSYKSPYSRGTPSITVVRVSFIAPTIAADESSGTYVIVAPADSGVRKPAVNSKTWNIGRTERNASSSVT